MFAETKTDFKNLSLGTAFLEVILPKLEAVSLDDLAENRSSHLLCSLVLSSKLGGSWQCVATFKCLKISGRVTGDCRCKERSPHF